ncbi:MAG: glycoside hydrolase family 3 protein [Clostridia bacterium]|nr:glycoside hydrolase family 3 protein [Clostridia bacterium]
MNSEIAFEYLSGKRTFDTESAYAAALKCAEDGIVLLENNGVLPLDKTEKFAFFGRMQKHYLMLGTGSGGRVDAPFVTNIFDSLVSLGFIPDKEVEAFYDGFVEKNPYDLGNGWSHPASQKEPLISEDLAASASERCTTALFVLTRTAGEDRDLGSGRGEFMLTETEVEDLKILRKYFKKLVVMVNACGVIDFSEIVSVDPDGLLMLWTGGMMGGLAAARVLTGEAEPSGRLPDTVARERSDYPAYGNFGAPGRNIYKEDIYVGYRYFSTFAPEKVIYPFGYGLSYTSFEMRFVSAVREEGVTTLVSEVTNTGSRPGRTVLQCYVRAPQGVLGKPERALCGFKKTGVILPGASETVTLTFGDKCVSSFDDTDPHGDGRNWIMERGRYEFFLGSDSVSALPVWSFDLEEDEYTEYCESALAPVEPFDRLVNNNGVPAYRPVNLRLEKEDYIPEELERPSRTDITFDEVADGKATPEDFVAQLSDEELICLVRAEGMSSPKVTPGTAAAFVGVTEKLRSRGLPILCCTDGPSGIRMVSDAQCVAYPGATCLAATWDTEAVEKAYEYCGAELATYRVDILLGPGTNIHRDPLCGRNFEYFSEDPLLSGKFAAAVCRGLDNSGVSGAVKHFMANNQETDRHGADSVISERAIREIYGRPFEICVNESGVRSVMTSYNPVNGRWAASNYDLTIGLLRMNYGFDGFVMTDWWANVSGDDGKACKTNLAAMVHAGNDIYMVCPDSAAREDNLASALAEGSLARGELQRSAIDLCAFALESLSYRAERAGFGRRDLKAECDGAEPKAALEAVDGKCVYNSASAGKAIIKVAFVSYTPELTQTSVKLNVNTKNTAGFIIGGTSGNTVYDHREISLVKGDNEFVFTSENPDARALSVEIY